MPSLVEIGGFLVVIGGLVTTIYGVIRATRADRNSAKAAEDAKMVTNFQTLYDELKIQINRMDGELTRVKNEQADERAQWAEERKGFQRIIAEKDKVIEELRSQIADLTRRVNKNASIQNAINNKKS